ncbi:hypothetical protein PNOK_0936000 [Pyrrhoderma noxium]|uniref:Uncharacterized protein n=1 Tax=Pyrrhoderma noxium TaxID=2282107 RepID=A0A286U5H0_9AGAM|nr:hypothetical protein PNOK_0936000 [Pyrrhoderma noxium]
MKFFLAAGFILPSLVLASASPASPMENNNMKRSSEGTMGCGAYGPLGSQSTVIFGYCTPGTSYVCEATDSSGCSAGESSLVEQLVIRDPSNAQSLGGSATVSQSSFTCPTNGMVQCSVILTEDGVSKASQFGIRIYSDKSS